MISLRRLKLSFILSVFFLTCSVCTTAQTTRTPEYFFTKASEYYFTDQEMDSLFYNITDTIFQDAGIPKRLFEKKYPEIKLLIAISSKKDIVSYFKSAEFYFGERLPAKNSETYTNNRNEYVARLAKSIRGAFYFNNALAKYIEFKGSDRIRSFNSTIRVQPNGTLLVEEKIKIFNGDGRNNPIYWNEPEFDGENAINDEIQRGIVRTFPLYYVNKLKLFQNTTFKLLSVHKDGYPEPYHTEKRDNGILIFTGSKEIYLDHNKTFEYTLLYETDRQLKMLNDFDELYWNVTGNSWSFRIDSASCTIILPNSASVLSNACYTGAQGEARKDCSVTQTVQGDSTVVVFKMTKPLQPNTGLTVATSWKKGFLQARGIWSTAWYYIWNNKAVFFFPLATLFTAIFCFFFWRRHGVDPEKGTIYPQYDPPAGYSPAALGYIYFQKFKRQFTAATIVDAAVRQTIRIDVAKSGMLIKHNKYSIEKGEKTSKAPMTNYDDYYRTVKELIGTDIDKGKYNSKLAALNKAIQKDVEKRYKVKDGKLDKGLSGLFSLNSSYQTIPIIISIVAGIWGFFGGLVKALTLYNFWQIAYWIAGLILCIIVTNIFSRLLRAYNAEGRKLMDKIEGFRMFLATADEQRFDMLAPPARSLELYEKYLPFAVALGCDIEWGRKFEDIINSAYLDGRVTSATSFTQSMRHDSGNFSSSFASSFSGAIASASTPPSSSSSGGGGGSSFGGGSSGGGGGGGGGGGW